jgi:filamentous hemagglutinin family protein
MRKVNRARTTYPRWQVGKIGLHLAIAVVSAALGICQTAVAQIVADPTLGAEGSRVNSNVQVRGGAAEQIEGGARRGANLFHSFQDFNVRPGERVYFSNPAGVDNILTRVTGRTVSNILGTLGVDGGANLFLLNPNGILFGPGSRLDISGSFVGTTANSFLFPNQIEFSATNPQAPPLLTVNVPIGLQYGANPAGAIAVNQSLLEVAPGRNLILAGGNVTLDASTLATGGGRIELGGLTDAGSIGLTSNGNQLQLNFPNQATRADVSIVNGSAIGVAAGNGGNIAINARNLEIVGGSRVVAGLQSGLSFAGSQAGDITLNSTGTIRLDQSSEISNFVAAGAIGNAGDIQITAGSLSLSNNSFLRECL